MENSVLTASYRATTGDHYFVYADGGHALFSQLQESGQQNDLYEGEFCEAMGQFAEAIERDVHPGRECACGRLNAECTYPNCESGQEA